MKQQFKKAQVILLKTNDKSDISLGIRQPDKHLLNYHKGLRYDASNDKNIINQHLYIVNDDKIEAGDWYISSDGWFIDKAINDDLKIVNEKINGYKKIIATTDSTLFQTITIGIDNTSIFNKLPQPSIEFIEQYIESYNEGNIISDVKLEYEINILYPMVQNNNIKLKINPDNTIIIKI